MPRTFWVRGINYTKLSYMHEVSGNKLQASGGFKLEARYKYRAPCISHADACGRHPGKRSFAGTRY
jgi:hypothetical protein